LQKQKDSRALKSGDIIAARGVVDRGGITGNLICAGSACEN